jgi:hypothetical protein
MDFGSTFEERQEEDQYFTMVKHQSRVNISDQIRSFPDTQLQQLLDLKQSRNHFVFPNRKQKSFAESLCKHDWILNIDADEELTDQLQEEIKHKFSLPSYSDFKAYDINFVIMHRNDKAARFFAPANRFIRLYNRKFCSFANTKKTTTHDAVTFNSGSVATSKLVCSFKNPAYHRSASSIEQLINKANFYSGQQAKDMISLSREPSILRIACELPLCFLKAFIIRRYFIFGFDGFVDSVIFAFARFSFKFL